MPLQTWFGFAVAAAAVIALPGPTVMLVVGTALSSGARAAFATILGVAAGDATAITVVFAGVGAALATEPRLLVVLRWAGAVYLAWLGLRLCGSPPGPVGGPPAGRAAGLHGAGRVAGPRPHPMLARGWLVTVLNPKGLLFFAAFMPQFVAPGRSATTQMVLLGTTHVVLAISILGLYVRLSERIRRAVADPGAMRLLRGAVGVTLIAAAVLAARSPP